MLYSIDKKTSFCWINKFLEAPPDTQFITMFSPHGINSLFLRVPLKLLQHENLDSGNGTFSLTDWEFTKYVVTPVISLFANSNNCFRVRICSEKGLCQLARAANLFKVLPTHSQGKLENLCRNYFIWKNRAAQDQHLLSSVTARHICISQKDALQV